MARETAAPAAFAAVVVDQRHAEMQLDIGYIEIGVGFEKSAAFRKIGGHRPAAFAPILHDGANLVHDAAERHAREILTVGHVLDDEIRMLLQILSYSGQMMHRPA